MQNVDFVYMAPDRYPRDDAGNVLSEEDGEIVYTRKYKNFYDENDKLVLGLEVDDEGRLFRWMGEARRNVRPHACPPQRYLCKVSSLKFARESLFRAAHVLCCALQSVWCCMQAAIWQTVARSAYLRQRVTSVTLITRHTCSLCSSTRLRWTRRSTRATMLATFSLKTAAFCTLSTQKSRRQRSTIKTASFTRR